jgi:hypothetical protein
MSVDPESVQIEQGSSSFSIKVTFVWSERKPSFGSVSGQPNALSVTLLQLPRVGLGSASGWQLLPPTNVRVDTSYTRAPAHTGLVAVSASVGQRRTLSGGPMGFRKIWLNLYRYSVPVG